MTITAKIIADSISHKDIRLTTLLLKYPRYCHSEFMTHRMLSKNASSSRAIPIARIIDSINKDPIYPAKGKNQKGMQAGGILDIATCKKVDEVVDKMRSRALQYVWQLSELGLHKQSANRYLEPFSHISVLVSATEWNNFFALRDHPDAQPEMQTLARCIREAMDGSVPEFKEDNEWHLPFVEQEEKENLALKEQLMLSVARCATISFARPASKITLEKALEIYNRLTKSTPIHASPFEHQAKPIADSKEASHVSLYDNELYCGNFRGWMQYRHVIPNNYVNY